MPVAKRKSAGRIVVVSGASGAGKSTLCRRMRDLPGVCWSISVTTRPRRRGEEDGVDYHFVREEDFRGRMAADEFAEYALVFGSLYGTPRGPLELVLERGGSILVEVDVQGAMALKERYGEDVVTVFVTPSTPKELAQRLSGRSTETDAEMTKRLARAEEEIAQKGRYDHVIVNDDLEKATSDFRMLLKRIAREA